MNKFLVVGLGNIGDEYAATRHNIGFRVVDFFAQKRGVLFEDRRYGFVGNTHVKNADITLLKPSTYMNLSGTAVRYWLQKENIDIQNLLIIVDDLALPFGSLRLRGAGSDGGHNGLKNIASCLMTTAYARLRFGIGADFQHGAQINFVLGGMNEDEEKIIADKLPLCSEIIESFCLQGLDRTMNMFNHRK